MPNPFMYKLTLCRTCLPTYVRTNGDLIPGLEDAVQAHQELAAAGITQGQLQLKRCAREDLQEEVVAPTAGTPFHGDAVLARVLLQQR
jgi:hypothetical protein